MPITQDMIKAQLQTDAQITHGNTGKEVAGVIDGSLGGDQDVLRNQALMMARARRGIAYESGADFDDDFVRHHVLRTPKEMINRSMSSDTIMQLTQGQMQRDQQYVGNNADWTGYYLEPLAKFVQPFDTPVRNMLPRTPGVGIDVENWRAITSVFNGVGPSVGSFILSQQTSPQKAQYVWANKSNLLRQLAWSDIVTEESEIYGRMFEPDVRAKVAAKLAPSLMVGQETWYLNSGQNVWSPPPPNGGSTAASGGNLSNGIYWIAVTAVNAQGETLAYSIAPFSSSAPGALSIAVTAGGVVNTISFNVMRVPNSITGGSGATPAGISYRVYIGTGSTQPANSAMWRQAATLFVNNTNPSLTGANALDDAGGYATGYFNVTMTGALATAGTALSTIVTAGNTAVMYTSGGGTPANQALSFDGLQSLTYLNAGALSTVGEGGETAVVKRVLDIGGALQKTDIDAWLEAMYFNARANPECLLVGIKDHKAVSNIVMNATNFRVNATPTRDGLSSLVGGGRATGWVNQTTGRLMDIIMCPYLTQGTIMALSLALPFQVAEIDKPPVRVSVNREMWSREYPPDQSHPTQWMYAAYTNETVVNQYLGGMGILSGIVTV